MTDDPVARLPSDAAAPNAVIGRLRDLAAAKHDDLSVADEAADLLEWFMEARAEIERLTDLANKRWRETKTTQSELSTLRARVREVVGPFAAIEATGWTGSYLAEPAHDGSDVSILYHAASNTTVNRGHFRAAKLLMEELK